MSKVTIYHKGAAGNILRTEGHLVRIDARETGGADVVFVKKGGRHEVAVMSYYSSFWLVVDGWGHPQPDDLFLPARETVTGCMVARGRYRSCDPAWVQDFMRSVGADLRPIAMYRDGALQVDQTTN